MLFDKLPKYT